MATQDDALETVKEVVRAIQKALNQHRDDDSFDWDELTYLDRKATPIKVVHNSEDWEMHLEDYYTGEEDGESRTWIVFRFDQFPNRFWQVTGQYSSWDDTIWDDVDYIHEVVPKAVVKITYVPA